MKGYTIDEYKKAGCNQMYGAMLGVHGVTNGRVCDTGCGNFEEGQCLAYQEMVVMDLIISHPEYKANNETVKQEATRRGISISEVRRQRRDLK